MSLSIEELKENYKRISDSELERLALQEASDLTPEAIGIMRDEIKKRGLAEELQKGIDVQLKEPTEEEILEYTDLLRAQPCPHCGQSAENLNAVIADEVISFLHFSNRHQEIVIGCQGCLKKANINALIKTILLGWWGFPGVIRSVQAISSNIKYLKESRLTEPNMLLIEVVKNNIGKIEASKNNDELLQRFVKYLK